LERADDYAESVLTPLIDGAMRRALPVNGKDGEEARPLAADWIAKQDVLRGRHDVSGARAFDRLASSAFGIEVRPKRCGFLGCDGRAKDGKIIVALWRNRDRAR
jgi:hypothetical protein